LRLRERWRATWPVPFRRNFNPRGLYAHGWNAHNPDAPQFYWGRRAAGSSSRCDVLDVLPRDHPGREKVLTQLRAALNGVARYLRLRPVAQMVDRNDSYLETAATAMFTYGLAHAVNEGWISPTTTARSRRRAGADS